MIALFISVSIALTFVIRLLNKVVKKLPVIKQANKLAGGLLGLVKAVVIIFVISTVLVFVQNEELAPMINSSVILKVVNDINPLLNIFN